MCDDELIDGEKVINPITSPIKKRDKHYTFVELYYPDIERKHKRFEVWKNDAETKDGDAIVIGLIYWSWDKYIFEYTEEFPCQIDRARLYEIYAFLKWLEEQTTLEQN